MCELNNKTVLVTGAGGFIGSHIVDALLKEGAIVVAFDIKSAEESCIPKHIFDLKDRFYYVQGDISDVGDVTNVFIVFKIDMVCHQAALAGVPMSFVRPDDYIRVNVLGTNNIFDTARRCGVKKIVWASSSSIYGEANPYAYTKIIGEKLSAMYNKLYKMDIIGLRYFNVFGPRQKAGDNCAIVPAIVNKILANEKTTIYGDGEQTRDFTFVRDVAEANIRALKYEGPDRIFDMGLAQQTSINQLYKKISTILNLDPGIVYEPAREGDLRASCAFESLNARTELAWNPQFTVDTGLEITCQSYKKVN